MKIKLTNLKKNIISSIIAALMLAAIILLVFFANYIGTDYKTAIYIVGIVVFLLYELLLILEKAILSKALISLIVLAVLILAVFLVLDFSGFWDNIKTVAALRDYIASTGNWSVVVFILIQFLQVVLIPIPGTVTTLAGAILFGSGLGALYSYIGIVLGALVAFLIGRIFGFKLVKWIVGEKDLEKGLKLIEGKTKVMFTLMFLLPFFPDDLICFVAGLTTISFLSFFIITVITRIITVAFTCFTVDFVEYFLRENITLGIIIISTAIVLTAVTFFLCFKYGKQIENFFEKLFKRKDNPNKPKKEKKIIAIRKKKVEKHNDLST